MKKTTKITSNFIFLMLSIIIVATISVILAVKEDKNEEETKDERFAISSITKAPNSTKENIDFHEHIAKADYIMLGTVQAVDQFNSNSKEYAVFVDQLIKGKESKEQILITGRDVELETGKQYLIFLRKSSLIFDLYPDNLYVVLNPSLIFTGDEKWIDLQNLITTISQSPSINIFNEELEYIPIVETMSLEERIENSVYIAHVKLLQLSTNQSNKYVAIASIEVIEQFTNLDINNKFSIELPQKDWSVGEYIIFLQPFHETLALTTVEDSFISKQDKELFETTYKAVKQLQEL